MNNTNNNGPTPYYVKIDEHFVVNIAMFAWYTLGITWNIEHPDDGQPYSIFHFKNQGEMWISLAQAKIIWRAMIEYLNKTNNQNQEHGDNRKYA